MIQYLTSFSGPGLLPAPLTCLIGHLTLYCVLLAAHFDQGVEDFDDTGLQQTII